MDFPSSLCGQPSCPLPNVNATDRGQHVRWAHRPQAYVPQKSVAEVFEIGGHAKVATADELNHSLQVVLLFSGDANLSIL